MKSILIVLSVLFMLLVWTIPAFPLVLDLPEKFQVLNQWCWAGVSESILDYYGQFATQSEIADYGTGGVNTWNYLYGQDASRKGINMILDNWGVSNTYGAYTMTLVQVQNRIDLLKPFVIRWGWYTGGGHFVAGRGYSGSNIYYMDPWPGEGYQIATYAWVVDDGIHAWTHSLEVTSSPLATPSPTPTPEPTAMATPTSTPQLPTTPTPTPEANTPTPPPTATPEVAPTAPHLVVDWDDYDGDGATDIAVYEPDTGEWNILEVTTGLAWGGDPGDIPAPGDYDGDGAADLGYFDRFSGEWNVVRANGEEITTGVSWGSWGDIPVPGDYDGDGTADLATWRPGDGRWRVRDVTVAHWGIAGDIPVPGDYNGDGTTDIAMLRPGTWTWYVMGVRNRTWGKAGDIARPMDYDGDGTTEVAVWRPAVGVWWMRHLTADVIYTLKWGVESFGDIPVVGDFDGDGLADPTLFRPARGVHLGRWWIYYSSQPAASVDFSAQSTDAIVTGATSY